MYVLQYKRSVHDTYECVYFGENRSSLGAFLWASVKLHLHVYHATD